MESAFESWNPKLIRREIETYATGSEVVAVSTNAGNAFAKFKGGGEGPHVLACEWIGTHLARELNLPVLDFALINYDGVPEIVLMSGRIAEPGTAWVTREIEGLPWSGFESDLEHLSNPEDIAKLVLLDQWTKNCDRYRPATAERKKRENLNNVFFSREGPPGKFLLLAMDHTHILTCGSPLTTRIAEIASVRDPVAYGLFPAFEAFLKRRDAIAAVEAMNAIAETTIRNIVAGIPSDWEVEEAVRDAIVTFLLDRRSWLSGQFVTRLFAQEELDLQ